MAVVIALIAGTAVVLQVLPSNPCPGGGGMAMHCHPRLRITIDGQAAVVPADIGTNQGPWRDHSLDEFGMEGMSPLHTHEAGGTIHVESRVVRDYALGDVFRVWGQSFDSTQVLGHPAGPGHRVWMTVDGKEVPLSQDVVLRDRMDIHIVCGPA